MDKERDTYDDAFELAEYIVHNYRHLLTDVEAFVSRFIMAEHGEGIATQLLNTWRSQNDPRLIEALKESPDLFRSRIRSRILEFSADAIFINRCPACERIVATPKAQQCLWCGNDWHH